MINKFIKVLLVLIVLQQPAFGCSESSRKPVLKLLDVDLSQQVADQIQYYEVVRAYSSDPDCLYACKRLLGKCKFDSKISAIARVDYGMSQYPFIIKNNINLGIIAGIKAYVVEQAIIKGSIRPFTKKKWRSELAKRPYTLPIKGELDSFELLHHDPILDPVSFVRVGVGAGSGSGSKARK